MADWIRASLLLLGVAAGGAGVAIAVTNGGGGSKAASSITTTQAQTHTNAATTTTTRQTTTTVTTTLPTTGGLVSWPKGRSGWTVLLVSYPLSVGEPAVRAVAQRAAKTGLTAVGVIDSSDFASLNPGYLAIFSGIYSSEAQAEAATAGVRAKGFGSAYARQITP